MMPLGEKLKSKIMRASKVKWTIPYQCRGMRPKGSNNLPCLYIANPKPLKMVKTYASDMGYDEILKWDFDFSNKLNNNILKFISKIFKILFKRE